VARAKWWGTPERGTLKEGSWGREGNSKNVAEGRRGKRKLPQGGSLSGKIQGQGKTAPRPLDR